MGSSYWETFESPTVGTDKEESHILLKKIGSLLEAGLEYSSLQVPVNFRHKNID